VNLFQKRRLLNLAIESIQAQFPFSSPNAHLTSVHDEGWHHIRHLFLPCLHLIRGHHINRSTLKIALGVSHAFELNKMISLKLAASASYLLSEDEETYPEFNGDAEPTDDKFSNLHDGTMTASLPIKATQYITVTPLISYVFPLSGDAKDEMKGRGIRGEQPSDRDSSFLYGGVTLSFTF